MVPLALDEEFVFSCQKELICFTHCCRDLNQFLTPYDIIRLKTRLGLTSGQFLHRFTVRHIGPETGFPIVSFKSGSGACPFISAGGCRVYEDRPSSCRIYPLVRIAGRSRGTGKISERYMLLVENHCMGFETGQAQTVEDWIGRQGARIYNRMNDRVLELIGLKNERMPDVLDPTTLRQLAAALYDIDRFRADRARDHAGVSDIHGMDDPELLEFSIRWVKERLFGLRG